MKFFRYYDHTLFYLSVIKNEKFFIKIFHFGRKIIKNIRNPFLKNEKYVLRNIKTLENIFLKQILTYIVYLQKKLFQILKEKILQKMF